MYVIDCVCVCVFACVIHPSPSFFLSFCLSLTGHPITFFFYNGQGKFLFIYFVFCFIFLLTASNLYFWLIYSDDVTLGLFYSRVMLDFLQLSGGRSSKVRPSVCLSLVASRRVGVREEGWPWPPRMGVSK